MFLDLFAFVLLFPLFGFLLNGLFGKQIGEKLSGTIATFSVLLSFGIVLGILNDYKPLQAKNPVVITLFQWFSLEQIPIAFQYQIDQLSLYMSLIITGIGSLIHIYSIGYRKGESGNSRYFAYLNLFIFFMLNLVLASNLIVTFLGWEGVGLASYLLIGFDLEKKSAADAGMKAFIMNRIGDLGFILGSAFIFLLVGSFSYEDIIRIFKENELARTYAEMIAICFFIACMGKSAQLPLYTWLPDAMAGPTPVSALIHAATMVTAGVFLIARLNVVYSAAPIVSNFILWVGALTAFFSAIIATMQRDIKKVLAYSTVSQLGFMFMAMGAGAYVAGLFHLMTHAFFKALLFLGSGSVILALHHEQNMENMGNLRKYIPVTFWTFAVGTLAIAGIPPFSGFFSKDLILEKVFLQSKVLYGIGAFAALLTAFYMFRLLYLVFFGSERISAHSKKHLHESPKSMTVPLVILAIGASIVGLLQTPHSIFGIDFLEIYFSPIVSPYAHATPIDHKVEIFLIAGAVLVSLLGIGIASAFFLRPKLEFPSSYSGWKALVYDKFRIDELYEFLFVTPHRAVSEFHSKFVEISILDKGFGAIAGLIAIFGKGLRWFQTGVVGDYALMIVIGIFSVIVFVLVRGI